MCTVRELENTLNRLKQNNFKYENKPGRGLAYKLRGKREKLKLQEGSTAITDNNDYKLFTTILANRLKTILQEFIHQDQGGFYPK